ncbi:MAG TPA: endonuclease/exonuclease/phosphatase family protein [Chthoniobacteraceae bacterium]|jgi:endonuclease/exonuclease/phosphatase family metal-dependent hydrolase
MAGAGHVVCIVRIMTYNVHGCVGTDGVRSIERIVEVIAAYKPDIIALQELDVGRARSGGAHQARLIAEALRVQYHFHPAMRMEEEEYGDAILSAHPLELVKAAVLPTPPSRFLRETRGALWIRTQIDGVRWEVINTHFGLGRAERFAQAQALLSPDWAGAASAETPLIVVGDFNSRANGRAHRVLTSRFRDAQREAPPYRHGATFMTRLPFICVDHIFVSAAIKVNAVNIPRTPLTRAASDHFPLIAELALERSSLVL